MLTLSVTQPFYLGGASTADILGKWHVALDGHPYMIDTAYTTLYGTRGFRHYSVPLLRQSSDQSDSPSESSINPDDLWRRSQDSWHHGAGQSFYDRGASDPARFNTSKGVDPWTRWQLSLLHSSSSKHSSVNTNLALVAVGGYLYYADGQTLRRTADVTPGSPTWTTITGTDASTITSMCTDGFNLYVAQAAGVYSTTRGAATAASYSSLTNATLVRYVKGRLMAAVTNNIYNITAASAAPAALFTHPNTDFRWVDFAEGATVLYAAGFSGDKSLIYKTSVKADGTALDIPTVAGELPDGEIVRSLQGYLGFLLVGTDKGVRVAQPDTNGNLTVGSLIPTTLAVQCFEPQDRFVWYGLTNYDAASTGLGRIDLSVATAPLTPAYASDLMATAQGAVLSVVTFQNLRVFAVSGIGVYGEDATPVASGTLDSGQVTYRLPDDKAAMFVDVRHDSLASHSMGLSVDGGAFADIGSHTTSADPFPTGEKRGFRFETRITLTAVANVAPVIRTITLRAEPTASTVEMIDLPILLAEVVDTANGSRAHMDTSGELAHIRMLRRTKSLVTYQEGATSYSVLVTDFDWRPTHLTKNGRSWNGTVIANLKQVI